MDTQISFHFLCGTILNCFQLEFKLNVTYIALFRYHDYSKASARILLYVMIKEDI